MFNRFRGCRGGGGPPNPSPLPPYHFVDPNLGGWRVGQSAAGLPQRVGASNGQVAVSAFGSGCACPTAVIAICPICQCSAEPQLEVCSAVHSSSLCPLAAFASWALQGYACIQVNGHSLPVVLL